MNTTNQEQEQENVQAQAQALIDAAELLVKQVKDGLQQTEGFYRAENIDPEEMQAFLNEHLTDEGRAQAQELFQADLDAIGKEVADEAARRSLQQTHSSTAQTNINMIA